MSMLVAPETAAVRPMSCRPVVISVAALGLPVAASATPVVAPVRVASANDVRTLQRCWRLRSIHAILRIGIVCRRMRPCRARLGAVYRLLIGYTWRCKTVHIAVCLWNHGGVPKLLALCARPSSCVWLPRAVRLAENAAGNETEIVRARRRYRHRLSCIQIRRARRLNSGYRCWSREVADIE